MGVKSLITFSPGILENFEKGCLFDVHHFLIWLKVFSRKKQDFPWCLSGDGLTHFEAASFVSSYSPKRV
jgi:hypothetical protein